MSQFKETMQSFEFLTRQLAQRFCELAAENEVHTLSPQGNASKPGYFVPLDETSISAEKLEAVRKEYDNLLAARAAELRAHEARYARMTQAERVGLWEEAAMPTDEYFILGGLIRQHSKSDEPPMRFVACNWCRRVGDTCNCGPQ